MSLYKVIVMAGTFGPFDMPATNELFEVIIKPDHWVSRSTEMLAQDDVLCYIALADDGTAFESWAPNGLRRRAKDYTSVRSHVQYYINKRVHEAFGHAPKVRGDVDHTMVDLIARERGIGETIESMIATYMAWKLQDGQIEDLPAAESLQNAFNTRVLAEMGC